MRELILGGVRSGKSRLAEELATRGGGPVTLIATATALDAEMRARIAAHQARRPPAWTTVEEPLALADALRGAAAPGRCVIVECLTLWLTNLLLAPDPLRLEKEQEALLEVLPALPGHIVLVSNETGLGIMPMGELSRRFGDAAGALHQALAARCERVILTVAGLAQVLKGPAL